MVRNLDNVPIQCTARVTDCRIYIGRWKPKSRLNYHLDGASTRTVSRPETPSSSATSRAGVPLEPCPGIRVHPCVGPSCIFDGGKDCSNIQLPDNIGRPFRPVPCDFKSVIMHFSTNMSQVSGRDQAAATSDGIHFFSVSAVNLLEAACSYKSWADPSFQSQSYQAYNEQTGAYQAGYGFAVMQLDSLGWDPEPQQQMNIVLTSILMSASGMRMGLRLSDGVTMQRDVSIVSPRELGSKTVRKVAKFHWRKIECMQQVGNMCAVNAAANCLHVLALSRGALTGSSCSWYPSPSCILTSCAKTAVPRLGCTPDEADKILILVRQTILGILKSISGSNPQKEALLKQFQASISRQQGSQGKESTGIENFANKTARWTEYYSKLDMRANGNIICID